MTGKSSETAIYHLVSEVQNSLDNQQTARCTFLDFEGAFDNTPHKATEKALGERGAVSILTNWTNKMPRTRTAETTIGNNTIEVQTRGCPHGGVSSPLL